MDKRIGQKVVSNTPNKLSFFLWTEKYDGKVFFPFSFFTCTTWEIWYLMDTIIKAHEIISCMPLRYNIISRDYLSIKHDLKFMQHNASLFCLQLLCLHSWWVAAAVVIIINIDVDIDKLCIQFVGRSFISHFCYVVSRLKLHYINVVVVLHKAFERLWLFSVYSMLPYQFLKFWFNQILLQTN